MSTTTNTQAATTKTTSVVWMRVVILGQAVSQGWTHTQVSTSTDQFTKGSQVVLVSWGSGAVETCSHQASSKVSPKIMGRGHKGKLQFLSTKLGHKAMSPSQKWSPKDLLDSKGEVSKLDTIKAQATSTFLVKEA